MAILFIALYFVLKAVFVKFKRPRATALEIVAVLNVIYLIVLAWHVPNTLSGEEVGGLIGETLSPTLWIVIGMGVCAWLRKRKAARTAGAPASETPRG
ncbi:MAG: hypothetical protein ACTHJ1_05275 [Bordetella sp.]|uniref:hypothetical protein n=1 Tax=Bordetella sp. TaxID=28081 RepID=UPI003F7B58C6